MDPLGLDRIPDAIATLNADLQARIAQAGAVGADDIQKAVNGLRDVIAPILAEITQLEQSVAADLSGVEQRLDALYALIKDGISIGGIPVTFNSQKGQ